jgi:hypothetical protein
MECLNCNANYEMGEEGNLFTLTKIRFLNEEKEETSFDNFCHMHCVKAYVKNNQSPEYSYYIKYNTLPITNCDLCGDFTHPTEFCVAYGTSMESSEKYEKIHGIGYWSLPHGHVYSFFLSPNHQIEFTNGSVTSKLKQLKETVSEDIVEIIRERYPVVLFQASFESANLFLKQNNPDGDEITHTVEALFGFEIEEKPINQQVSDQFPEEMVCQILTQLNESDKLFMPYDITKKICFIPITENSFDFRRYVLTGYEYLNDKDCEALPMLYQEHTKNKYIDTVDYTLDAC